MPMARARTSGPCRRPVRSGDDVAEWTSSLPAVTGGPHPDPRWASFQRDNGRAVDVDMRRLVAGIPGRHVEATAR